MNESTEPHPKQDVLLPAHSVVVFDPARVFAECIGDRKIVYLDNNVWIELRDRSTTESQACLDACTRAVSQGTAIFPLSYAAVSEVLENPVPNLRARQADLMDELSRGVTFRNRRLVYANEGEAAYRYLFRGEETPLRRQVAFTRLPDHLGNSVVQFPAGWRRADAEGFVSILRSERSYGSLRWMVDHLDLDDLKKKHASIDNFGPRLTAQRVARDASLSNGRKVARDAAVHEERLFLFKEHVLPAIRMAFSADVGFNDVLPTMSEWRHRHGDGDRRRFASVFKVAAPSMELAAQLLADCFLNKNRKPQRQDFWDFGHASLAPVYADAFVTGDRGLATLLRSARRPSSAAAKLLTSASELNEWLSTATHEPA